MNETLDGAYAQIKRLERWARGAVCAVLVLVLLTPLVFSRFGVYAGVLAQSMYFRAFVELLVLLYLALVLLDATFRPKISLMFWAFLLFVGSLSFSSMTGMFPSRSFWGTFARGEGIVFYLHLFAFFLVLSGVMKSPRVRRHILRWVAWISVPVGIMGMIQKIGIFDFYMPNDPRVGAAFGNPTFYAGYLLLALAVSFFLAITEKIRPVRIFFWAVFVFNGVMLLETGTRGAWIGALIAVCLIGTFVFSRSDRWDIKKRCVILGSVALVLVVFLGVLVAFQHGWGRQNFFVGRYQAAWNSVAGSENERVYVWKLALRGWEHAPFFGYGLETFEPVFTKYYPAEYGRVLPQNQFFDRAHNQFLDMLVEGGAIGLLSYLFLFGAALLVCARKIFSGEKDASSLGYAGLGAFLVGYLAQIFFAFDSVNSFILLAVIFAAIGCAVRERPVVPDGSPRREEGSARIIRLIGFAAVFLIACAGIGYGIFYFSVRPFSASAAVVRMNDALGAKDYGAALDDWNDAINASPPLPLEAYYYPLVAFLNHAEDFYGGKATLRDFINAVALNANRMSADLDRFPDAMPMQSYLLLTRAEHALYLITEDPLYLAREHEIIRKMRTINPNFIVIDQVDGELNMLEGNEKEGDRLLSKVYEADRDLEKYYNSKARGLLEAKRLREGLELIRKGFRAGSFYTPSGFTMAKVWETGAVYTQLKDWQGLADFYEEVIARAPAARIDPQLYASLAVSYRNAGEKESARKTFARMELTYPNLFFQIQDARARVEKE